MTQSRRPWHAQDLATLHRNAHLGAQRLDLLLGRTPVAVRLQASRQRISLRPPGQRAGRIIGDPADPELRTLFRADPAAATRVSQAAVKPPQLCPRCARRTASPTLGMCRVCHARALADAHREEAARLLARRTLDQARQAKHRALEQPC